MWHNQGSKLTGYYGTWNGRDIELNGPVAICGKHQLIQDGGPTPGPDWITTPHPKRFARTSTRHHLDVDQAKVSDVHAIEVHGFIGTSSVKVSVIAQNDKGYLAVESSTDAAPGFLDRIAEEYGLTSDGPLVYGWIHPEELPRLVVRRISLD